MPELPEVETIRRGLTPLLTGRRFDRVEVRERRLRELVQVGQLRKMEGSRVSSLRRRSKYLLIDTDAGLTLLVHLGMSGRLWVAPATNARAAHEHVAFDLDDGRQLRFADPRRFGLIKALATNRLDRHPRLRHLGPDPLDEDLTGTQLFEATRQRRKPVKNFLLDSHSIAGVGNIYACESLHRAGINPKRAVGRIGRRGWEQLLASLREVLIEAIEAGGTTLRDFLDAEENAGFFALALRAYDQEGEDCRRCGGTIRRIVQSGRSTFYCPRCQH